MCGIFGAVLTSATAAGRADAVHAFLMLGLLAEERGTDAAGVAFVYLDETRKTWTPPVKDDAAASEALIDGSFIVKEAVPFRELPLAAYREMAADANILMGHTRWATQGDVADLTNASPLLAGALIGTHNGDIDTATVPAKAVKARFGATDTEALYLALDKARLDRRDITEVLRRVHGRAALAFYDRSRDDRFYLARTALAPLSYATDAHGNLFYASNPDWFRQIEATSFGQFTFTNITLVPEGHLLTVDPFTGAIADVRRFTPVCREQDVRMMNLAAYRGFTAADKAADLQLHRHKIAQPKLGAWPKPAPAPAPKAPASAPSAASLAAVGVSAPALTVVPYSPAPAPAAAPTPGSLSARLAAEEPDPALDYDDIDRDTPDFNDDLPEGVGVGIDIDQLEEMCWASGQFDHRTFEKILDEDDEDVAMRLFEEYRDEVLNRYPHYAA